jgi:hypothetical protein
MLSSVVFSGKNVYEVEELISSARFTSSKKGIAAHSLSLRKGEGERHVLLTVGSAASFGTFSRKLEFFLTYCTIRYVPYYLHCRTRNIAPANQRTSQTSQHTFLS